MQPRRPPVGTPQTLREGLRRPLFVFAASGVFTAIGLLMIFAGGITAVLGVVGVAFFGVGVVVGAVLLAGGGRKLRLDSTGLEWSNGFGRAERVRWDEITQFSARRTSSYSFVGYGLTSGPPARERRTRGVVGRLGIKNVPDAALPTLYGRMSAKELAAYLNEWHRGCPVFCV